MSGRPVAAGGAGRRAASEALPGAAPQALTEALLAYVTVPDEAGDGETAVALARHLVEQGLAAGVNVADGARSVYRWQGEIREARERILFAQVAAPAFAAFCAAVAAAHPHAVPCVLGLRAAAGHGPFVRWIGENSAPPGAGLEAAGAFARRNGKAPPA